MRLPQKPQKGDDVKEWAGLVVDYLRSLRITSFVGGRVSHTSGGTCLYASPLTVRRGIAGSELHPWKLRQVDGEWQVYGTGSTIEKRWAGTMLGVIGLDSVLTLAESVNYVYLRANVEYGELVLIEEEEASGYFRITVEALPLDRIVTADGEQTELNILIGTILDGVPTQRLRDPLVATLTCAAGVPAWVPILSEGVAP